MKYLFLLSFNFFAFADFNSSDLEAAKYIAELERKLSRPKVSKVFLNTVEAKISKSKIFIRYKKDLDIISQINLRNSYDCSNILENDRPYGQKLLYRIKSYCYQNQLEILKTKKNISEVDKVWLKQVISFFANKDISELTNLILKTNHKSDLFSHVLNTTVEIALEDDITLPNRIVKLIELNGKVTALFQKNLPQSRRNQIILTNEFLKIYKGIKEVDAKPEIASQLVSFHHSNKSFIFPKTAWKKIIYAGIMYREQGLDKEASILFDYAIDISYSEDKRNEALFQTLWTSIYKKNFKQARVTIEKLKLVENFTKLDSKVKFWTAYTFHAQKETSISKHLFNLLIENNPLNYYSIISQNYVPKVNEDYMKKKFLTKKALSYIVKEKDLFVYENTNAKEMLVWKKLNYASKVDNFISHFVNIKPEKLINNKEVLSDNTNSELIASISSYYLDIFKDNNDHLSSFKYITKLMDKDTFSFDHINIADLFPVKHLGTIKSLSYTTDPLLVLSIIRQESAFNERAQSSVGARGLMQLMPSTARSLGKIRNNDDLFHPYKNIKYGVKYLEMLLKRFDGNLVLTLSSYNAGPTKVNRWVKNHFIQEDPLFMVEEIPYKETRLYVKLIYRNLFFYNLIENNYIFDKSLKNTFKVVAANQD